MYRSLFVLMLAMSISAVNASQRLSVQAVENATFSGKIPASNQTSPFLVKAEVLLDRAHFSPGQIDGKMGEKALAAYADAHGLQTGGPLTNEIASSLSADTRPILTQYVLTEQDLKGPFTKHIPAKMEEMKGLKKVGYRDVKEAIAERFHVSERLLAMLNPGIAFPRVSQQIVVPNVLVDGGSTGPVTKVEVNKDKQTVKAYGQSGELVAFYPATVGSEEKPSPVGTFKIISIDRNPHYRYNPDYKFKGVKSKRPFVIGPGPNNPVGIEWIGLSAEGYGIHGTPDPSKVSKSASHGCVNGGLGWLECNRCKTRASIPLDAVRRPRDTPLWKLEAALKCRSCRKGRYAPPVHMVKLTEAREITPYRWVHPDEDR